MTHVTWGDWAAELASLCTWIYGLQQSTTLDLRWHSHVSTCANQIAMQVACIILQFVSGRRHKVAKPISWGWSYVQASGCLSFLQAGMPCQAQVPFESHQAVWAGSSVLVARVCCE